MDEIRMDSEKFIKHIKNKIRASDIHFEDFYRLRDDEIERIMIATFVFARKQAKSCYFCKHYKRFGFSMCKIQNHIQDGCFYHELDKHRLTRKHGLNICVLATHSAIAEGKRMRFFIPPEVEKKIIFESLNLFEFIDLENKIRSD